ncbi:hypothetical protein [Cupriavidus pauculus]|uniref:hypothetical protein n=1 Tax=Cupriavidus pauculus TaxID=82633 RepID=UPI000ABF7378|nr:hypothetical protein [Cupriavidus pauculus]
MAENDIPKAPPPALFSLDLGANGGVFAPTSATELFQWIDREIQVWTWLSTVGG